MKTTHQKRRFIVGFLMTITTAFLSSCDPTVDNNSQESNAMLSSCLTGTLQNGLISFYPFNSGNINDASGNGQDLENPTSASASPDRFGNPSCAMHFGSGDYLRDINPQYLDGLDTYSISLWYQEDSLGEPGAFRTMVARDSVCITSSNTAIKSVIGTYDCSQPIFSYDETVIWYELDFFQSDCIQIMDSVDNQWHHLVGVFDNGNVQLWLDGSPSNDVPGIIPCSGGQVGILGDLLFGRNLFGSLDDIVTYDRVLSSSEIQSLFALAPCCQ